MGGAVVAKTETIRARVEPELKREAEEVLGELGMSATDAITLFYTQVAMQRGLPFDVRLPNAETVEALQQAQAGTDLVEYLTLEDLKVKA
jgi:DNA-damage-inducible protein J